MITNSLSIKVSTSCCFLLPPSNTGKGLSQGSTNPPLCPNSAHGSASHSSKSIQEGP